MRARLSIFFEGVGWRSGFGVLAAVETMMENRGGVLCCVGVAWLLGGLDVKTVRFLGGCKCQSSLEFPRRTAGASRCGGDTPFVQTTNVQQLCLVRKRLCMRPRTKQKLHSTVLSWGGGSGG